MDIMWPISQSQFHVSHIMSSMFIEIKFVPCHFCVMFAMNSMSICID